MLNRKKATAATQLIALTMSLCMARFTFGAPADIVSSPAPVLESDPPKTRPIEDGDYNISTQTGAFQYSYPIVVPPGRNGMVPHLALSYSSQGAIYGGIAAGWTMSVPSIEMDPKQDVLQHHADGVPWKYISSMAGGNQLIPVNEPQVAADVQAAYRAQYDTSYARYEQLAQAMWRVRATDGTVYTFGDPQHQGGEITIDKARISHVEDIYGNAVDYFWQPVIFYTSAAPIDFVLTEIQYTSNVEAGLSAHARVVFDYDGVKTCGASQVPVGAQLSFRGHQHRLAEGSRKLTSIRTEVVDSAGNWRPVRDVVLTYNSATALCSAGHAPYRELDSIQEFGHPPNGGATEAMPPVTFAYGRVAPDLGSQLNFNLPTDMPYLSWGSRPTNPSSAWPTGEQMLMDIDGDGLQDLVEMDTTAPCRAKWWRNDGTQFTDLAYFDLPMIPWADGSYGTPSQPEEHCSLVGQLTMREDVLDPHCTNTGSYLAYRFLDLNGDHAPEIVAAIQRDPNHYDPNLDTAIPQSMRNVWSSCNPDPQCPEMDPSIAEDYQECESAQQGAVECRLDLEEFQPLVDSAPRTDCGVMFAPADTSGGQDPCKMGRVPHTSCERYPWMILWNHGDGTFDTTPQSIPPCARVVVA